MEVTSAEVVSGRSDTFRSMSPATATPSPHPLPRRGTPIVLRRGRLELRQQGQALSAVGRIELELRPSLRFRFVMPTAQVSRGFLEGAELYLPGLRATVPVFVTNTPLFGVGTVSGTVENASVGSGGELVEARFLVANLPDFLGDALREAGEGVRSSWAGRLELRTDEWTILLDERREYADVYARLKAEGGFEITHTGSLRRRDGTVFTTTAAGGLLDALAGFLGVASGAWATPLAAVGFDADSKVVWREWKARWTSPWRHGILCAFDRHKHDLNSAFAGYLRRWHDPLWNEPLRIATQMYVEANSPVTADTSLVLGQNILELVAWVRFVEDLQTHTARDFDNPRRKASERLRELIAWLSVPPSVPAGLTTLRQESQQRGWADGPHAITEMRNSLIHPRGRQRLTATPVRARIELQELVLWYVELTLLRLIDYRGGYANRLGSKTTGVVEPVPWP
jgi:hypothetical protein